MSVSSTTLAFLASKGLSTDDLVEAARLIERDISVTRVTPNVTRSPNAERQARHRIRKKAVAASVTSNVTEVTPKSVTEVTECNGTSRARETVLTSLDSKQELSKERPPKGGPKKGSRRTQISPEAQPDEQDRAAAQRAGMSDGTFRNEWQKFRAHHAARGSAMANWRAAWTQWIANWTSYGAKQVEQAARAGPRSGTTGFAAVLDHLEGRTYDQPAEHKIRDITPSSADTDRSHDPSDLFEPAGRVSGGGEILDFRAARADVGGQAVAYGPAWRASG